VLTFSPILSPAPSAPEENKKQNPNSKSQPKPDAVQTRHQAANDPLLPLENVRYPASNSTPFTLAN